MAYSASEGVRWLTYLQYCQQLSLTGNDKTMKIPQGGVKHTQGLTFINECRPLLFAKDFQKHLEAIDMIQGELSSNQQAVMASLDLLLRCHLMSSHTVAPLCFACRAMSSVAMDLYISCPPPCVCPTYAAYPLCGRLMVSCSTCPLQAILKR